MCTQCLKRKHGDRERLKGVKGRSRGVGGGEVKERGKEEEYTYRKG